MASLSFLTHFETAQRGVLDLRALLFFGGFTTLCVALNTIWLGRRRGGAR